MVYWDLYLHLTLEADQLGEEATCKIHYMRFLLDFIVDNIPTKGWEIKRKLVPKPMLCKVIIDTNSNMDENNFLQR